MTKTATAKLRKKAEQAARAKQERLVRENQERVLRENQDRALRLNQERVLQENQKKALIAIEEAANNARECGILSEQAYDKLIDAGLNDMRRGHVLEWSDAVVVSGIAEPEPVHADFNVPSPITASVTESIVSATLSHTEEVPPVEECVPDEAPSAPMTMCTASACPPPEPEEQPGGECADDSSMSSFTFPDRAPIAEEATGMANTEAHQEPTIPNGSVITHCFGCLRVDVVEYAKQTLPAYLRPHVESLPKPVVLVLCGTCRKDPHFSAPSSHILDDKNATSWSRLRLSPEMFEGSPAMRTIQHLLGGEVSILTANGGILYRDVDRIVRSLEPDDRMSSIDVAAFRRGQRDHLKLPYIRGGLAAST